jgi:signal transduction histidine kinase
LRAQTQEELLRAREQFSQMLVHDLKNPLTAATGYLDILKLGSLTEDQLLLSDGAYRSIKNALILVSQILDVARLSEGRLEIRCEVADVRRMFETCIEELQTLAKLEDATVQVAPYVSAPNLFVDVSLMQRVLHNLVSNAIKHTPSGVTVTLGANLLEDGIELFVHDNGPGIDSSILPTIFERFQSGIATNADHNNTGLGLTFCKLATEAHHGTIAVESGQGNGTTFTIILPTSCIAAPDTLLLSSTPREISSVEALP